MSIYLFDWGNTLMVDNPEFSGPMCDWPVLKATAGAVDTLAQLSIDNTCCLATNARDSNELQIRSALKRVGLAHYIAHIFCYKTTGFMKPEHAYFTAIKQRLGCSAEALIMVGDDLEKDILGAQACGLRAIWFNPTGCHAPTDCRSIKDLSELLDG